MKKEFEFSFDLISLPELKKREELLCGDLENFRLEIIAAQEVLNKQLIIANAEVEEMEMNKVRRVDEKTYQQEMIQIDKIAFKLGKSFVDIMKDIERQFSFILNVIKALCEDYKLEINEYKEMYKVRSWDATHLMPNIGHGEGLVKLGLKQFAGTIIGSDLKSGEGMVREMVNKLTKRENDKYSDDHYKPDFLIDVYVGLLIAYRETAEAYEYTRAFCEEYKPAEEAESEREVKSE